MWELDHRESWAPKNWCFWTVCWRRLLRVPWTARRSNQSTLKEINPEYSLEGHMLKLNLQYFGHLNGRANSLEKMLMLGKNDAEATILWPPDAKSWLIGKDPYARKDWGQEKRATEDEMVGWRDWLNGHKFELTPGDPEGQRSLAYTVHGVTKSQTRLSDWTTIPQTIHELCMRINVH